MQNNIQKCGFLKLQQVDYGTRKMQADPPTRISVRVLGLRHAFLLGTHN